ncbi:M28 family peptidase [Anthropogastromicrobium sp.]|uniref:M28 family peptidase n=1 Tax=Anthropogastromicrobium sp. TaxID=2981649 RepID=UPI003079C9D4
MKICKRIKATVLALCLVIGMCAVSFPQTVHAEYGDNAYAFMKQLQSNYPYRQVNSSNGMLSGAEEWLKAQIATMGYEYMAQPFTMTSADGVTPCYGENLIFSKQGASDRVIVVGAHYDCVEQTFGTDDNASGVGVLLELASIYSTKESPYTIRFILFSAEEPGCLGSQYYVDNLSQEERDRIACMINIDTIAAGDNMYLYGGTVDDSGSIVQDWAVYQAQSAADLLGLDMSFHPDVNDSFPTPTKATASDQMPFANVGIPYIYCEASNWNGEPYTNFYQTSNSAVDGGTIMHKAEYDNLTFIENTFGTRAYEHLQAYAKLLDYLLENMKEGEYATGYTFEDTNTKATTTSSVYLREKPTQYSPSVTLLDADTEVTVTGYHASWCRVEVDGQEGYIKTDYLTMEDEIASKEDESSEEESENASEEASKEAESSMSEESSSEAAENESEEAVSESESSESESFKNEASKNETVSEEASSEKETDGALSQSASSQNASAPEADSQNTVEKIIDQLKNDPYTLRIVLIAAIIIIGIWLCVFIALRRKKNAQKNEDSNGASNSSEETLKKAKRADMSDSKDSDNGFADPDKNKDEK